MDEEFQTLLDAHPGWSKEVRADIATLGEGTLRESAKLVRLDVTQAPETDPVVEDPAARAGTPPRNTGASLGTEADSPAAQRWRTTPPGP